ncbi:MAG: transcriptional regulator FilR1 domain-containing protein [Conexivisphaerales archaeon]
MGSDGSMNNVSGHNSELLSDNNSSKKDAEQIVEELLFAVSNQDRLKILKEVSRGRKRLTQCSKLINATNQECTRHLHRLYEQGLIEKDQVGFYKITPFGRILLQSLRATEFIAQHKETFLTHELSYLPAHFVERIGELSEGMFVDNISMILRYIENAMMQANEFLWLMSDQPIVTGESIATSALTKPIPVRLITTDVVDRKELSIIKERLGSRAEIGTLSDVHIAMVINEQAAGFCLPDLSGKVDFRTGFAGADFQFIRWCTELYQYYWERSRKVALFE